MRATWFTCTSLAVCAASSAAVGGHSTTLHVGQCSSCTHSSLTEARDHIRKLRQESYVLGAVAFEVVLHEGSHQPLSLDDPELDSNVVYRGFNTDGEAAATITAGTPIPKSAWTAAGKDFVDGVIVANLTALGLSPGGTLPETGTTCCDGCDQETQLTAQLFHHLPGQLFQPNLARYPNADGNNWHFLHSKGHALGSDKKTPVGIVPADADAQRVMGWMKEEAAYAHGYWEWDWADGIMHLRSGAAAEEEGNDSSSNNSNTDDDHNDNGTTSNVLYWAASVAQDSKPNARYFGLNLLSELDAAGEYHLSRKSGLLHYLPAVPLAQWDDTTGIPVWSTNETAVYYAPGTHNVTLDGVTVAHAVSIGVSGVNTSGIVVSNVTVMAHGARGVQLTGSGHSVRDSQVSDVGCRGIEVHCGDLLTLAPGGCDVTNNHVTRMAQYKRTYQPGIHWGGVDNSFSHNTVVDGPHNCFLGGGNEAGATGGVGNVFEYNTLDNCAFEASDTGAFYTCGQQATAYVNPGNILRHSTFKNIRSTSTQGVQGITIQAIYLDDQMSSWEIYNNSFINCTTGTFVGGGRLNNVHDNYYQDVGTCHHFDNRGMGWQKNAVVGCTAPGGKGPCVPNGGCTCDPPAIDYVLSGPAAQEWEAKFPALVASHNDTKCRNAHDGGIPCYNIFSNNTYCRAKTVVDTSAKNIAAWHSVAENNTEISCK